MLKVTRKLLRAWQTISGEGNDIAFAGALLSNPKTTRACQSRLRLRPCHFCNVEIENVQMGRIPLHLLDLHHSADNHQVSPHDLTLTYHSGQVEHFAFGKRVQKRSHRYARTLDPMEDVITTIEVLCIQNGSHTTSELEVMRTILRTAYTHRHQLSAANLPTLQNLVNTIYWHPRHLSLQRLPLTPALVEHFFDQLHDRCIADIAPLLERTGDQSPENTYGELTPHFISTLCLQTSLSPSSTFLDLGSGVGQVCMQTSLETGCTSFGIERDGRCHAVAMTHFAQFALRAQLWGAAHGSVHLRHGDFLACPAFVEEELLTMADVVLVNNLKLEPESDWELQRKLTQRLKSGAVVVSTRPLAPIGRAAGRKRKRKGKEGERLATSMGKKKKMNKVERGRREKVLATPSPSPSPPPPPPSPGLVLEGDDEVLVERRGEDEVWTWTQYVYPPGSVSWSDKRGVYYISVKK